MIHQPVNGSTFPSLPLAAHLLLEFDVPEDVVHPKCLGQNWTKEEGEPNGSYPNSSLWERVYSEKERNIQ